jgi:predicted ABC-type ATPase
MHDERKIIIFAGPNGAGKTTIAREFLPNEAGCPICVNADLIAAGLARTARCRVFRPTCLPAFAAQACDRLAARSVTGGRQGARYRNMDD